MPSPFRICITRADGEPVYLYSNAQGERDLVTDVVTRVTKKLHDRHLLDEVVKRTVAKGVGVIRTEAHVSADLKAALVEVDPILAFQHDLITSLQDTIMALKSEVLPT